jgi:hypothetical protein
MVLDWEDVRAAAEAAFYSGRRKYGGERSLPGLLTTQTR